jgi:hypothetical protein
MTGESDWAGHPVVGEKTLQPLAMASELTMGCLETLDPVCFHPSVEDGAWPSGCQFRAWEADTPRIHLVAGGRWYVLRGAGGTALASAICLLFTWLVLVGVGMVP